MIAQREQDRDTHELQVQRLHIEIQSLKEPGIAGREEVTRLNRDNARLVAELADSEKERRDLKADLGSARGSLNRLSTQQA